MRSIILAASLSLLSASAQAQLTARLQVIPETTLPGVPATIRVTVSNASAQQARLPQSIALVVTTPSSETFPVLWNGGQPSVPTIEFRDVLIPGNGTAVFENRTIGSAITPGWFDDPRLNTPSRLHLRAVFGAPTEQGVTTEIASNTVLLQIQQPDGDDAKIWSEMLMIGKGRWQSGFLLSDEGHGLARRVVTEIPHSQYAGWFATAGVSGDMAVSADVLRAWLSQAAADEYTEWRQWRLGVFEEDAARYWGDIRKDDSALHRRNARAIYEPLLHSRNSDVASRARESLNRLRDIEREQ